MIINNIVINNIKTLSGRIVETYSGKILKIKQEGGEIEETTLNDESEEYCNNLLKAIDAELNPTQYGLKRNV
jgi:uncharacterized surface protein with fasciclin (FAS1) repeats